MLGALIETRVPARHDPTPALVVARCVWSAYPAYWPAVHCAWPSIDGCLYRAQAIALAGFLAAGPGMVCRTVGADACGIG